MEDVYRLIFFQNMTYVYTGNNLVQFKVKKLYPLKIASNQSTLPPCLINITWGRKLKRLKRDFNQATCDVITVSPNNHPILSQHPFIK